MCSQIPLISIRSCHAATKNQSGDTDLQSSLVTLPPLSSVTMLHVVHGEQRTVALFYHTCIAVLH